MNLKKTGLSIAVLLISIIQISYSQKIEIKEKDSVKFVSLDSKIKLIKHQYDLNDFELNQIVKNDTIIKELVILLKDSTKTESVKQRLKSYYQGNYSLKDLIFTLKLERLLEVGSFELSDSIDFKKAVHFKNAEDLSKFIKKIDDTLMKNLNFNKKKDSIKKKKQKL